MIPTRYFGLLAILLVIAIGEIDAFSAAVATGQVFIPAAWSWAVRPVLDGLVLAGILLRREEVHYLPQDLVGGQELEASPAPAIDHAALAAQLATYLAPALRGAIIREAATATPPAIAAAPEPAPTDPVAPAFLSPVGIGS